MKVVKKLKAFDLKEINACRKSMNLAPLMMGDRNCLRCDKKFYSEDLKNQKICENCREKNIDACNY